MSDSAGRSPRPPTATRPMSLRSRPMGASMVPRRDGGRPRTRAMYSRSISRAPHLLAQRRVGLVAAREARAGRTCRGRGGGRHGVFVVAAPRRPRLRSAATRVGPTTPGAGRVTTPAGLSATITGRRQRGDSRPDARLRPSGAFSASSSSSISSPPARRSACAQGRRRRARRRARSAARRRRATAGRHARRGTGRRRRRRPRRSARGSRESVARRTSAKFRDR